MVNDPITDMFNRIKNAQAVEKKTVVIPFSKLKKEIARVLKSENLIENFDKKGKGVDQRIEITLSYKDDFPGIDNFRRRSKPSQRQYISYKKLFPIKSGYGIAIISTSKGIMSDKEARKSKLGGEFLVELW